MDPAIVSNFGQLDFRSAPKGWIGKAGQVHSDRTCSLASHHFPVLATVSVDVPKSAKSRPTPKLDFRVLLEEQSAELFRESFEACMQSSDDGQD